MVIPQGNDEAVIDYYTGNEDQFEAVVEASKIGLSLLDKYRKIPLNLRYSVVLFNEIVSDERQMGLTKGKEYSGNEVQNTMLGILNRRIVAFRKQG